MLVYILQTHINSHRFWKFENHLGLYKINEHSATLIITRCLLFSFFFFFNGLIGWRFLQAQFTIGGGLRASVVLTARFQTEMALLETWNLIEIHIDVY